MESTMLYLLLVFAFSAEPTMPHVQAAAMPSIHSSTIEQLDARNASDTGNDEGARYEARVMSMMIDEIGLLRTCELSSEQKPFSLYLDIADDGTIKDIRLTTEPPIAACIRRTLAEKKFPPFEGGFLVKLIISAV
jgi:hypothetical protein